MCKFWKKQNLILYPQNNKIKWINELEKKLKTRQKQRERGGWGSYDAAVGAITGATAAATAGVAVRAGFGAEATTHETQ